MLEGPGDSRGQPSGVRLLLEAPSIHDLIVQGNIPKAGIDERRRASRERHSNPIRDGHRCGGGNLALRRSPSLGHE